MGGALCPGGGGALSHVRPTLHQRLSSTVMLSPVQCFHFLSVCPFSFQSLLSCNMYVSVSVFTFLVFVPPVRSVCLSLDPEMRPMLSANHSNVFPPSDRCYLLIIGMFSRPPTAIVSMKFSLMHRFNLMKEHFEKAWRQDTTLANSGSS